MWRTSKKAPWSSCKIGIEDTEGPSREVSKISLPEFQLRESAQISTAPRRDRSSRHTHTHKVSQSAERVARAIAKFAPGRAKCREGCTSDIKIRTAPQLTRGRHAPSAEGVAGAISKVPNARKRNKGCAIKPSIWKTVKSCFFERS